MCLGWLRKLSNFAIVTRKGERERAALAEGARGMNSGGCERAPKPSGRPGSASAASSRRRKASSSLRVEAAAAAAKLEPRSSLEPNQPAACSRSKLPGRNILCKCWRNQASARGADGSCAFVAASELAAHFGHLVVIEMRAARPPASSWRALWAEGIKIRLYCRRKGPKWGGELCGDAINNSGDSNNSAAD